MLIIKSKEFEVEEDIVFTDKEDKELYKFKMQITPDEFIEIKKIIFNEELVKEKDEKKIEEIAKKNQVRFEDICFKEHKEKCKELGEASYLEMVEVIYDFFWKKFIKKTSARANTMISDLKKIGMK